MLFLLLICYNFPAMTVKITIDKDTKAEEMFQKYLEQKAMVQKKLAQEAKNVRKISAQPV